MSDHVLNTTSIQIASLDRFMKQFSCTRITIPKVHKGGTKHKAVYLYTNAIDNDDCFIAFNDAVRLYNYTSMKDTYWNTMGELTLAVKNMIAQGYKKKPLLCKGMHIAIATANKKKVVAQVKLQECHNCEKGFIVQNHFIRTVNN